VRVPNESSGARTVRVDIKLPPGITFLQTEPVQGWTAQVKHQKLAKPIKTDDGTVTEEASEVIWKASQGGGTPPEQFQSFPMAMSVPGKAGQVLSFKTVQTYSNGKIVRWIEGPDASSPPRRSTSPPKADSSRSKRVTRARRRRAAAARPARARPRASRPSSSAP
jgi:uncharacterized protein YcnI